LPDLAVIGVDPQVNVRLHTVELGQPGHQPFLQEGGHHAHIQNALRAILAHDLHRLAQFRQTALHTGQQLAARFGQRDLAPVAMKQRLVQPLLERADLRADRSRADVQRLCPLGEAEPGRNGLERAQRIEWNGRHCVKKNLIENQRKPLVNFYIKH
jgi:hypothetical protein